MRSLKLVSGMVCRGLLAGGLGGLVMALGIALCWTGLIIRANLQDAQPTTEPLLLTFAILLFSFGAVGGLIGAMVGAGVGGIGGLLLALVTLLWFNPLQAASRYRQTVSALGFLVGFVPWVVFLINYLVSIPPNQVFLPFLFLSGGSLVSGGVGVVASRLVVRWYVSASEETQTDEAALP